MPYQLPAVNTLDDMFKMNPAAFGMAQPIVQGGMNQANEDLRASQLKNMFDQEYNPLRLEHQRKQNSQLDAQLPGLQAESRSRQLKADRDAATQDAAIKDQLGKFHADASDREIKQFENKLQEMAYSLDPQVAAKAQKIMLQHRELIKERAKQADMSARRIAEIQESGRQARLTQKEAIEGGKWAPKGGGKGAGTIEDQIKSGKLTYEKAAVMFSGAAFTAELEGDDEKADYYRRMADEYNNKHIASKKAGAEAGYPTKPDLEKLGIETIPEKPTQGFGPVKSTTQLPRATPERTQETDTYRKAFGSYEPDKYDYRIGSDGVPERKLKGK